MKISLPHKGTVNVCMDDSCDGAHCSVCGCHFADFYLSTPNPVCDGCELLNEEQRVAVRSAVRAEWDRRYGHQP